MTQSQRWATDLQAISECGKVLFVYCIIHDHLQWDVIHIIKLMNIYSYIYDIIYIYIYIYMHMYIYIYIHVILDYVTWLFLTCCYDIHGHGTHFWISRGLNPAQLRKVLGGPFPGRCVSVVLSLRCSDAILGAWLWLSFIVVNWRYSGSIVWYSGWYWDYWIEMWICSEYSGWISWRAKPVPPNPTGIIGLLDGGIITFYGQTIQVGELLWFTQMEPWKILHINMWPLVSSIMNEWSIVHRYVWLPEG